MARGTIALAGPVVANCPLIPKLVSSVPLAVYRVTNPLASKSEAARAEATKIFPLGRSASAVALSPASLAPFPLPKVGSGSPSDKKTQEQKTIRDNDLTVRLDSDRARISGYTRERHNPSLSERWVKTSVCSVPNHIYGDASAAHGYNLSIRLQGDRRKGRNVGRNRNARTSKPWVQAAIGVVASDRGSGETTTGRGSAADQDSPIRLNRDSVGRGYIALAQLNSEVRSYNASGAEGRIELACLRDSKRGSDQ